MAHKNGHLSCKRDEYSIRSFHELQSYWHHGVFGISVCPDSFPVGDVRGFLCTYIDDPANRHSYQP